MERNRLVYFIIGVIMLGLGYIVRFVGLDFSKEGSFFLIIMGLYFIIAIIFKKAATWVLLVIDLFVGVGMQYLRMINVPWYNRLYDSRIGQLLIGGPFETRLLIYILLGAAFGAVLEIVIRQYNWIGLGD